MADWDEATKRQFARFEAMGEAQVRAALENNTLGVRRPYAKRWLAHLDAERQGVDEDLAERAVIAAEVSAAAAEKSARWAGLAVFIALAALVVAAWPYLPK